MHASSCRLWNFGLQMGRGADKTPRDFKIDREQAVIRKQEKQNSLDGIYEEIKGDALTEEIIWRGYCCGAVAADA